MHAAGVLVDTETGALLEESVAMLAAAVHDVLADERVLGLTVLIWAPPAMRADAAWAATVTDRLRDADPPRGGPLVIEVAQHPTDRSYIEHLHEVAATMLFAPIPAGATLTPQFSRFALIVPPGWEARDRPETYQHTLAGGPLTARARDRLVALLTAGSRAFDTGARGTAEYHRRRADIAAAHRDMLDVNALAQEMQALMANREHKAEAALADEQARFPRIRALAHARGARLNETLQRLLREIDAAVDVATADFEKSGGVLPEAAATDTQ